MSKPQDRTRLIDLPTEWPQLEFVRTSGLGAPATAMNVQQQIELFTKWRTYLVIGGNAVRVLCAYAEKLPGTPEGRIAIDFSCHALYDAIQHTIKIVDQTLAQLKANQKPVFTFPPMDLPDWDPGTDADRFGSIFSLIESILIDRCENLAKQPEYLPTTVLLDGLISALSKVLADLRHYYPQLLGDK